MSRNTRSRWLRCIVPGGRHAAAALAASLLIIPVATSAAAGAGGAAGRSAAAPDPGPGSAKAGDLRNKAIAAYNAQDYEAAARFASRYLEDARAEGRTGREVAAIAFILGHARFEMHGTTGASYEGDYRADVVAPLEESLRILQDDPAFKNMLLGNAYHVLWADGGRHNARDEERAHWYLLKSIVVREAAAHDRPRNSEEYDLFARHLLFYLERCLDLARDSESANLYLQRIRSTARWGFATAYDARFWQIYNLTYFDDGNMRAAAVWQHGLDSMRDPLVQPDHVLAIFGQAADLTRHPRDRAEVFRQMADYASTFDEPGRRVQAADFARRAFDLDPLDPEIRRQFGTALHVLSYGAYRRGAFSEAREHARESVSFEWEGMEVAFFDLSRAAAELGHETEALTIGERAYRLAQRNLIGAALQPFAQNYVNILRQFGQETLAGRVAKEAAGLGVH
jgi:tetratricopeptide (TPR) repeat protein